MRTYLRYFSVGWSVLCVAAAVLLCALWVRSYWWSDVYFWQIADYHQIGFCSAAGRLSIEDARVMDETWHFHEPVENWREVRENIDAGPYDGPPRMRTVAGFAIGLTSADRFILLPHWLAIAIVVALGSAPWIRHINWHFSLRTLLIATTVIAVALGLAVWLLK